MSMNKYLFTSERVPNCSKDKINEMNRELIARLQNVARGLRQAGMDDDLKMYYSLADMTHAEVFVKHCGRHN